MKKLLVLVFVLVLAFALKSEAKTLRLFVDIKWGISDGKGGCEAKVFRFCSMTIGLRSKGNSETMESSGEIRNNMLVINLPKEIRGEENNSPGTYAYTLTKQMDLDADLAKELGFEKLSVAPGNYEFSGKTISLKIISPRDPASGQASGKRSNIAIDEPGVHKTTPAKANNGSVLKGSYDLQENKK